ncbi:MAG: DNA mismatch repair protein MutS [Bacteroidetes bacterium]|nr:DNA mismatch repair protein MutS [Bacteroidota bacterium]
MAKSSSSETPLMKQYNAVKAKYPGALLLFRVGDFYETFGEDAITASRILGITLTKRNNGAAGHIELAGFPHHSLDTYVPRLVRAGQRVAVCDQLEDPKLAKGIVKRGVTEMLSPGVALNDKILDHQSNNFLAAAYIPQPGQLAAAFVDLSTGDFFCLSGETSRVEKLLWNLRPSELVLPRKDIRTLRALLGDDFYTFRLEDWVFEPEYAHKQLLDHFRVQTLKGFGLDEDPQGATAAGVLLHYLHEMEQRNLSHITQVYPFSDSGFATIDRFSLRNLELLQPLHADGRSFFQTINQTATPMGARLLKRWIAFPLLEPARIQERQARVAALLHPPKEGMQLADLLKNMPDLERLLAKLATRRLNPREAVSLREAIVLLKPLAAVLVAAPAFDTLLQALPNPLPALELLQSRLQEECPAQLSQGEVIRAGVSPELDELRLLQQNVKQVLEDIRNREAQRTGIGSLKISYNKVFGYYIEITHSHREKVPGDYIRKQTLTNAERYITPELKELEDKILTAESRIGELEQRLYMELLEALQAHIPALQQWAQAVAQADVLHGFARLARERHYVCPQVNDGLTLAITEGRHPVIETLLPPDQPYVPNDVLLDAAQQILVITGPNMAGKSALLRQTALITLMAQMGSYVPAREAVIGVADRIYTRVGASDNLSAGESTFMVEMTETARILNGCTPRSLILMDEVGRGTSTYDGVSIAWALVEYLHANPQRAARTLFATHYHELAELAEQLPRVRNYNVSVREVEGKIIFLRKLQPGHCEHSFGIQVAQMAGMPPVVVNRARELLARFEETHTLQTPGAETLRAAAAPSLQLRMFEQPDAVSLRVSELLESVDPDRMSPIEALLKLHELKQMVQQDGLPS